MSLLSPLSTGDPAARELLQKAIRARYGIRPMMIENARLTMKATGRGFLGLPVGITMTLAYLGITQGRWDWSRKMFGFALGNVTERFDGTRFSSLSAKGNTISDDPNLIQSAKRRLWCYSAFWLTPLTLAGVMVKAVNEKAFSAKSDTEGQGTVTIQVQEDGMVSSLAVECYSPAKQKVARYQLKPMGALQTLNGLTVPARLAEQWDDDAPTVYTIVNAEVNPALPASLFTIS